MAPAPVSAHSLDLTPPASVYPSPLDWRDQFIYFLLVDRFDNNQADIPAYDPQTTPIGRDPAQKSIFQGGNLKGIMRRLDYLQNLGVGAIWLSPVFKNRQEAEGSYHGYGIQDFLRIDPRFGTSEDLQALVQAAHARSMYVILDIIINHTGDNWGYPGDYPYYYRHDAPGPFDFGFWRKNSPGQDFQADDAVWPQELQQPDCYKRRGQIRNWSDEAEAINGDFLSLKELELNRSQVLDTLIRAYKYWIKTADVDGFRIDTVKHMESSATAIFCNSIREYCRSIGKHNFFLFGEVVADDTVLQRYIGRNSRLPDSGERFPSLDACLDFPLYFVLEEVIKGFATPSLLKDRYDRFRDLYADHGESGQYFVTFVDNHDQMSRPYRRFLHANPHSRQAMLAMGYLLTTPGVPCIYYGTEQGFDGGGNNDAYVRECMFGGNWGGFDTTGHHSFNPEHSLYQAIAQIAAVRKNEPALRYGRLYFREISGNGQNFGYPQDGRCTLAYSRILAETEILICLNLDPRPRNDYVTLDMHLNPAGSQLEDLLAPGWTTQIFNQAGRHVAQVSMEGHSVRILRRLQ
nr:alpha-amylase family glycosyl hydrolase [uncultured Desulfobulbus sp.]